MRADDLSAILDGIGNIVIVKDRGLVWRYVNDAACRMVGRARDDLIGRCDHDFFPDEQANGFAVIDRQVLLTGEEATTEEEVTARNDTTLVLLARKRRIMLTGPAGSEPWLVASVSDITDLRRAEMKLRESEEHYRHSVELNPQFPFTVTPEGTLLEMSPRWLQATGLTQEEAQGTGWLGAVHPDDLESTMENWRQAIQGDCRVDHEKRIRLADGRYRWFRGRAAPRRDPDGRIVRWYGATEDIHDHKLAEVALRESEQRLRLMADNAAVMIWVTDPSASVTMVNRVYLDFLNLTEDEALGLAWRDRMHPEDLKAFTPLHRKAVIEKSEYEFEFRMRRADGDWAWIREHARPHLSSDGRLLGHVSSGSDITELRSKALAAEEERKLITHLALHDPLTDLPNRLCFERKISEALFQPSPRFALLLLDLDGFKSVNDTFGHAAGDALLRSFARRLEACVAAGDIAARLGGDEFVVLHHLHSDEDDGTQLAASILETASEPFQIDGAVGTVGVSIGMAFAPWNGLCKTSLLKSADDALYRAKEAGRGVYRHAEVAPQVRLVQGSAPGRT